MRPIIIHHVSKKSVEEIEPTIVGDVGRFKSEMPFADHAGVVARFVHQLGQCWAGRFEVTPIARGVLADYAGSTDQIRVTTCE